MPIPELTQDGWLPPGEHLCTLEEITEAFAGEDSSPARQEILQFLQRYLQNPRVARHGDHVLVDGSFTSQKEEPRDVDIVLGIRPDRFAMLIGNQPGMSPATVLKELQGQRTVRSGKPMVHAFPYPVGSPEYEHWRQYFQTSTRQDEPRAKGILRVELR